MSDVPLVTVLVPAYNHAQFIEDCLDSIASDTYPNLELLVLDDGSLDNTSDVAKEWIKNHSVSFVRTWISRQENCGVCATLNRLVEESRGKYLVLVASDDQLVPGGIRLRMEALLAHPQWLAVMGIASVIDEEGLVQADNAMTAIYHTDLTMLQHPESMVAELILHWAVPGPVLMVRREAFDSELGVGRYDEQLTAEDRDFYLRLLARKALGYIDVPVGRYRIHSCNLSRSLRARERLSLTLLNSCIKNLPRFTGISHLFLSTYIAYTQAYRERLKKPSVVTWMNLALSRAFVEMMLWGARVAYRFRWRFENLGRNH